MSALPQQLLSVACPCGQTHRFSAAHYDRVIVGCHRVYWPLRPQRNGPLVLFPHPGANLTREEMGGGKSAAQIFLAMNKERKP